MRFEPTRACTSEGTPRFQFASSKSLRSSRLAKNMQQPLGAILLCLVFLLSLRKLPEGNRNKTKQKSGNYVGNYAAAEGQRLPEK